jgi:hypothetical protein
MTRSRQEHIRQLRRAVLNPFPSSPTYAPNRFLTMPPEGSPSARSCSTLSSITNKDPELPPLPEIRSEQLLKRVFTRSVGHKDPFQASNGGASADNEE